MSFTDPTGNFSLGGLFQYLGAATKVAGITIAQNRALATAVGNSVIQFRLLLMLRPLSFQIERLRSFIASVNPNGSAKLLELNQKISKAISAPTIAANILLSTALGAVPGLSGFALGSGLTGLRLYQANSLAANVVKEAAEAVSYDTGLTHFSFSGNIPARRIGLKNFLGVLNPANDLGLVNDAIRRIRAADAVGASGFVSQFSEKLSRYGLTGNGSFGSYAPSNHFDYTISIEGSTLTPRF